MSKQKETRVIQKEWTKDDFEYHGFAIELRKTWFIFIPIVLIIAIVGVCIEDVNKYASDVLMIISLLTFLVWYLVIYYKGGRKFWKANKDKEQPIKIDKLPNMFGRKQK